MKRINEKGLTLVELLVTITIMGIIATAAIPLLSTCLDVHSQGNARSRLYQEGLLSMERMTSGVRRCTFFLIPNAHNITRDILAFSGCVNDDNDFYFGDPLFPRVDEDHHEDMAKDWEAGIIGVDDDGDGLVDEGSYSDDDEDGLIDEDWLDGIDNDGDGNIDEDTYFLIDNDAAPGIKDMDDDGDGAIDEGQWGDDDEDGSRYEDPINPVVYTFDSGNSTLTESIPYTGESVVLSNHVTSFEARYLSPNEIRIKLVLTGDDGKSVMFTEHVCPRNTYQKTGKRVR